MNTCKTCIYWVSTTKDLNDKEWRMDQICNPVDPDTWEPMQVDFEMRACRSPLICYFERTPEKTGITLCDGSEYLAIMLTGEDFGCINHKEAE